MMSNSDDKLDTCGCCEDGGSRKKPYNRPGLSALKYRIATHSGFLRSMLSRLTRETIPDGPNHGTRPLVNLATRSADDPAIALLDAWATAADVLTFYQERIANEGYLRTATERRSVLELARAIGYELNPGVAASAYLAFTLEDAEGSADTATIARGMQVQSVPPQDKLPQTFETIEDIQAHKEWNKMQPLLNYPQNIAIQASAAGERLCLINTYCNFSDDTEGVIDIASDGEHFDSVYMLQGEIPDDLDSVQAIEVERIYVQGITSNLETGMLLLIVGKNSEGDLKALLRRIKTVKTDAENDWTVVQLDQISADADGETEEYEDDSMTVSGVVAADLTDGKVVLESLDFNEDNVRHHIIQKTWTESDLQAFLEIQSWSGSDLLEYTSSAANSDSSGIGRGVFAFRERVNFFGHNAPLWNSLPASQRFGEFGLVDGATSESCTELKDAAYPDNWDENGGRTIWTDSHGADYGDEADVFLERSISNLSDDTWAVFVGRTANSRSDGQETSIYRISGVTEASLADYSLTGKASGLKLTGLETGNPVEFLVRRTTAFVCSEALELALLPLKYDLNAGATRLVLSGMVLSLQRGQAVAFTGEQADAAGVIRSEILVLDEITHSGGYTILQFDEGSRYGYIGDTVTINANVARATHGETIKSEIMGNGDGSAVNQVFQLKKPPLTHVSASTSTGAESTLEVRVNGVLWAEVPSLYGLNADSEKYIVRIDNDSNASVIFGDGKQGARTPSGTDNLIATYRSGIGPDGEVDAGSLTSLKTRPLGVREVTNPLSASGAEAPEKLENARTNAPLTVLTLERIVSLQDFEDFTRAFAGIGKARAVILWIGESCIVHITIAAANGDEVDTNSELYKNLRDGIMAACVPVHQVKIDSYERISFNIEAGVIVDSRYVTDDVLADVADALKEAFSFDERGFGQPVTAAEVVSIIHSVEGVTAVDLDKLYLVTESGEAADTELASILEAKAAAVEGEDIMPAQLLLINPVGIKLEGIEL